VFLVYCGQTTVVSPLCCCVWMCTLLLVTFALDELAVSQATERTYQATELVRNRITPLVPFTVKIAFVSNVRLSLVALVRSATTTSSRTVHKMCAPVLKCHQLQGDLLPLTPTGLCPLYLPGGSAPGPRYRLAALAIAAHPSALPI